MSHLKRREQPCRLCGMDTIVPGRICWTCHRIAHDAEADASGLPDAAPGALKPLWGVVLGRHILRRAVADRRRTGSPRSNPPRPSSSSSSTPTPARPSPPSPPRPSTRPTSPNCAATPGSGRPRPESGCASTTAGGCSAITIAERIRAAGPRATRC